MITDPYDLDTANVDEMGMGVLAALSELRRRLNERGMWEAGEVVDAYALEIATGDEDDEGQA